MSDYILITKEHDGEYTGFYANSLFCGDGKLVLLFRMDAKHLYAKRLVPQFGLELLAETDDDRKYSFSIFKMFANANGTDEIQYVDAYKNIMFEFVVKEGKLFSVNKI